MPDGTGAVMIDGKMQDDATWKQAKVIADLADLVAAKDGAATARASANLLPPAGPPRYTGPCHTA
jgi:hypothetical protein